jgi:hypothetical protein
MDPPRQSDKPATRPAGETQLWSGPSRPQPPEPGPPPASKPAALRDWAARAGRYREEVLYPPLFGPAYSRAFPIPEDIVSGLFKQESFKAHWLQQAVIEFAPTKPRPSWLYATSGLSDAWEAESPNPMTPAGLGCEFVLETRTQSPWAIVRLQQIMTFQVLIAQGRFPDRKPLDDFDRVPLRAPVGPEPSALTWLMLAPPTGFPRKVRLQSGFFNFFQVVGISEAEAAYARAEGGEELWKLLQVYGFFPVTDPNRPSVLTGKK